MSNDPNCPFGTSRTPEAAAAADAEQLRMYRRVVGEWHARAVGLGHDGVAAMLDVAEATTGNGACSKCGVHQSEACPMPDPDECIQRLGETGAISPEFCPYCGGSGESTARSGGGPDAWDEPCTCPRCKGAQTLRAAYDTLADELPALQLKVAQLGIFHSHATRYGWAPNQTTGMQSFRELATQWLAGNATKGAHDA